MWHKVTAVSYAIAPPLFIFVASVMVTCDKQFLETVTMLLIIKKLVRMHLFVGLLLTIISYLIFSVDSFAVISTLSYSGMSVYFVLAHAHTMEGGKGEISI